MLIEYGNLYGSRTDINSEFVKRIIFHNFLQSVIPGKIPDKIYKNQLFLLIKKNAGKRQAKYIIRHDITKHNVQIGEKYKLFMNKIRPD